MIKFKFFSIGILIISFFSFAETQSRTHKDAILYEFKEYPKSILSEEHYSLRQFFADNKEIYDENNSLNSFFNSDTPLQGMVEHRKPYTDKAILFKKIPLDKNLNIFLFAYWDHNDQDSYYNLPTLEMQIFDKNYNFINKIIAVDGAAAECSYRKKIRIYKNKKFEITEAEYCIDIETDKLMTEQHKTSYYFIDDKGNINFE